MNNAFEYALPKRPIRLMGAGPKNCSPGVLEAMAFPTSGHLVRDFLDFMDNTLLPAGRWIFDTKNEYVLPISGPGTSAMECCVMNLVEPGDDVVPCIGGAFALRLQEMSRRLGAKLTPVEAQWGTPVDPDALRDALKKVHAAKSSPSPAVVMAVGAETDTGTKNPLKEIAEVAHEFDAVVVADLVTLIAGHPVSVDQWGLDAAYFGPQKCVGGPPGVSFVTFGPRAVEKITNRKSECVSWMNDLKNLIPYFGTGARTYTTTPGVHGFYGLARAIHELQEEGLQNVQARHERNMSELWNGLRDMGLVADTEKPDYQLNSIVVARCEDEAAVRRELEENQRIELSAGLGPVKGKAFRIGPMGPNSTQQDVQNVLAALQQTLKAKV